MTRKKISSKLYMALVFLFLYAPIVVVIVFSFNATKSRTVFTGVTLKWYAQLFQDELIMKSLRNSLILALSSSVIATVIGTAAALAISRMKKKARAVVMNITYLPVVNSEIVTGISLMLLFVFVFGLITFNIPYVILNVLPKLRQADQDLFNAALDLGCNPGQAFFKVVLPEIMPGIVSAFLMAFSLSFDDFMISYFTAGSSFQTLPVTIYSMTRRRITPKINALFALIFVLIFVLLLVINIRDSRAAKRDARKES